MRVRWIIAAIGALGLALVTVYIPKPWTSNTTSVRPLPISGMGGLRS